MSPSESRGMSRLPLATRVTLLRFLGIPVFVLTMIFYGMGLRAGEPDERYRVAALAVFLLVALTDALDGFLARSRGEVTRLGGILDPLADKTLLLAAIILLTRPSLPDLKPHLPIWFALAVISRDTLLVIGAFVLQHLSGSVHIRPRLTGKIATALQMGAVVWVLASGPHRSFLWLAGAAVLFTLVSGGQYVVDGIRQIDRSHLAPRRPAARAR